MTLQVMCTDAHRSELPLFKKQIDINSHTPTQTCMHERMRTIPVFVRAPFDFHLIKSTVCVKHATDGLSVGQRRTTAMAICLCLH